jgi:hypothetical protein
VSAKSHKPHRHKRTQSEKNFYKDAVYVFYKKCLPHAAHIAATAK